MHKHENSQKLKIAVVGATGYSGLELFRLLKKHPLVQQIHLFATKADKEIKAISELGQFLENLDVVFLATPAEISAELAPMIISKSVHVIDLSGGHRLNNDEYEQWYKFNHPEIQILEKSIYGLVPWINKQEIQESQLIANPGCYATATLMGLLPLLSHNLIENDSIVIDAKSGTTGAGKKGHESQIFSEVDGECLPYKVGEHQHLPEIKKYVELYTGHKIDPFFTTHLLPVRRGIIAGIYGKLKKGITESDVEIAMTEFYQNYPLVKFKSGMDKDLVTLKKVVGTAEVHITYKVLGNKLYLFSCLDNLLKGAASQAVENLNLIYNNPIDLGLTHLEAIV